MRSVFSKYTMPLWYGYDQPMTPEVLTEILDKIQGMGYHVSGITCDNYSDNRTLAKQLGVTEELPRFQNPSPGKENDFIYFLYDPVHLMKLMRNHLLDQGTVQHFPLYSV